MHNVSTACSSCQVSITKDGRGLGGWWHPVKLLLQITDSDRTKSNVGWASVADCVEVPWCCQTCACAAVEAQCAEDLGCMMHL